MTEMQDQRVAILGLGLMGASLGLALRAKGVRVVGYNHSPANARTALERGAVEAIAPTPAEAVAGVSLVVLAAPVLANIAFADEIAGALAPDAVVTDMGSTKGEFCRTRGWCWWGAIRWRDRRSRARARRGRTCSKAAAAW